MTEMNAGTVYTYVRTGKLASEVYNGVTVIQYDHPITQARVERMKASGRKIKEVGRYFETPVAQGRLKSNGKPVKDIPQADLTKDIQSIQKYLNIDYKIDMALLYKKYRNFDTIKMIIDLRKKAISEQQELLKYKVERNEYVRKDSFVSLILQYLNVLNKNMFRIPNNYVDGIIALVESKGSKAKKRVQIIEMLRDAMEQEMEETKKSIDKVIKELERNYVE
jgi:hypothetical protein